MNEPICTLCHVDPNVRNNFLRECTRADCQHRHLARQWDRPPQAESQGREPPAARLFDDPNGEA